MSYEPGQRVTVPNPDGDGRVTATFAASCDPDQAVTVDTPNGPVLRDTAWIRYAEGEREGTTGRYVYADIRPA